VTALVIGVLAWVALGLAFLLGWYCGRCWRRRGRSADAGAGPRALAQQVRDERQRRTEKG